MAKLASGRTIRIGGAAAGRRRLGLLGTTVLQTALLLASPARAQLPPNAAPSGGRVVAGQASIAQSAAGTLIRQGSQRAAINWTGFNVGSQQTVQFEQPDAGAVALNRVIGPDPSRIAGRITANGEVILINQSGVVFSQGSQVNAQALVVSAANISNRAFMAGGPLHFDRPGRPRASIVNAGTLTVGQAGLAALVAPSVVNSGVIAASLGKVMLAGATRYTLDLYGDGLLAIDVTGLVREVPAGPGGAPVPALVTNTGTILAQGGTVTLTAAAADGLITTLVSAGGRIEADNAAGQGGTLVLDAVGGSLAIEGALTATGQTGGQVQAIASTAVAMVPGASIDVSGQTHGGTVALGTTLARAAGGPAVLAARTAPTVQVAAGATIAANATGNGHGGTVTVLSTNSTVMSGSILARGGPLGGDGGAVEVSGGSLGFNGGIDVGATAGRPGSVLFDPETLEIVNGPSGSGLSNLDSLLPTVSSGAGGTQNVVTDTAINGITGNVLLQAKDSLFVDAGVVINNHTNAALTLDSGGGLTVTAGATIALASGNLLLIAGDTGISDTHSGPGNVTLAGSLSANNLFIEAGSGNSLALGSTGTPVTLNASSSGVISLVADQITAVTGSTVSAPFGAVELAPATPDAVPVSLGSRLTGLQVPNSLLGDITTTTLRIGGYTNVLATGSPLTTRAKSISVNGPVSIAAATLELLSNGAITETNNPGG
jgi:filamentous hemagglutinin family protein